MRAVRCGRDRGLADVGSEEPESKAGEAKSPKTKAEDNSWYLLRRSVAALRILPRADGGGRLTPAAWF